MSNELDELKIDIKTLHERSQETKANLKTLTAISDQRNDTILKTLECLTKNYESLNLDIKQLSEKVDNLNTLATTGKASIRTLFIVGGIISSVLAIIASYKGWIF